MNDIIGIAFVNIEMQRMNHSMKTFREYVANLNEEAIYEYKAPEYIKGAPKKDAQGLPLLTTTKPKDAKAAKEKLQAWWTRINSDTPEAKEQAKGFRKTVTFANAALALDLGWMLGATIGMDYRKFGGEKEWKDMLAKVRQRIAEIYGVSIMEVQAAEKRRGMPEGIFADARQASKDLAFKLNTSEQFRM